MKITATKRTRAEAEVVLAELEKEFGGEGGQFEGEARRFMLMILEAGRFAYDGERFRATLWTPLYAQGREITELTIALPAQKYQGGTPEETARATLETMNGLPAHSLDDMRFSDLACCLGALEMLLRKAGT